MIWVKRVIVSVVLLKLHSYSSRQIVCIRMIWLWAEMHLDICNGTLTPIIKIWPIHEKSRLEETFSKWGRRTKKSEKSWSRAMVLNCDAPPTGVINKFQGDVSPCTLYNMESLIIKFTNKLICVYSLFKVRGLKQVKDSYLKEAW